MVEMVKVINIEQKKECENGVYGWRWGSLKWWCGWRCRDGGVEDGSMSECGTEFENRGGSQSGDQIWRFDGNVEVVE